MRCAPPWDGADRAPRTKENPETGLLSMTEIVHSSPEDIAVMTDRAREVMRLNIEALEALERSIDVQISRLRRMIEPDPSKPRYIQTVWGVGYVFVPDGNATK